MIYKDNKNNEKNKAINRIKYKSNKLLDNNILRENLIIIVDKQEKRWEHIKYNFDKYKFKYTIEHLKTGDYSFYYKNKNYSTMFSIERKNSIEELISSMIASRFEREISRAKLIDNTLIKNNDFYFEIMIEAGTLKDILSGNHNINIDSHKMYSMIQSRKTEYDLSFNFIEDKNFSADWILSTIKYYLKNKIRKDLAIKEKIYYNK